MVFFPASTTAGDGHFVNKDTDSPTSNILTIQWRVPHIGDNIVHVYGYFFKYIESYMAFQFTS